MLDLVVWKSKISMQINGFPLCCPQLNTGIVNHQTKQTQNFLPVRENRHEFLRTNNQNQDFILCFRPFYKQSFR